MTLEDIMKKLWNMGSMHSVSKQEVEELLNDVFESVKSKSCEGCVHHKAYNGNFSLSCCECSRFYSDNFEEIKK